MYYVSKLGYALDLTLLVLANTAATTLEECFKHCYYQLQVIPSMATTKACLLQEVKSRLKKSRLQLQ